MELGSWIVAVVLLGPEPDAPDVALSWRAPPTCPTQADVIARVHARIAARAAVRVQADAIVEPSAHDPGLWRLRLAVHGDDATAQREIEAKTCDALADAAAIILAVAATSADAPTVEIPAPAPPTEPEPEPSREPPAPGPAMSPTAPSPAPVDAPPIVAPTVERRPRPRARIAAHGGVDHGAQPGTNATAVAEIGLHWSRLRVSASAIYGFARRVATGEAEAVHRLAAAGISACGVAPLAAFEVGGCVGGELGALVSDGTRGTALRGDRSWWGAASIGVVAGWRFAPRWSLVLRTDAVVPAVRRRFFVGDDRVGRIGAVGVRALAGVAVVLP